MTEPEEVGVGYFGRHQNSTKNELGCYEDRSPTTSSLLSFTFTTRTNVRQTCLPIELIVNLEREKEKKNSLP